MKTRTELHTELCKVLGTKNVYFQPPSNVMLKYPCIIYELSDIRAIHADNRPYRLSHFYTITFVDKNPETKAPGSSSTIIDTLANIPNMKYDRHYVADGLYHDVFTIYY